jgi:hypothetical protein
LQRLQTSEEQEGPGRAQAAPLSLLPLLPGRQAEGQGRAPGLQHLRSGERPGKLIRF